MPIIDKCFMTEAIALAQQASMRQTAPNPCVGAVVLDANGQRIATGWHKGRGQPHAEAMALAACPPGQADTVYVTLEPCNHTGKTPPCTHALVAAGVKHVVYGMQDPNPLVAGQGLAYLQTHGIQVHGPVLPEACQTLNPGFMHWIQHETPFTTLKLATTLDGYMQDARGNSRWLTQPATRAHARQARGAHQALLTTAKTILADNSHLISTGEGPPPLRIVLDAHARLLKQKPSNQPDWAVFDIQAPSWVFTQSAHTLGYQQAYPHVGVHPLVMQGRHINLHALWPQLYQAGLCLLWVEAGPTLCNALLQTTGCAATSLVQQVQWYQAPLVLGGGRPAFQFKTALPLSAALQLKRTEFVDLSPDSLSCFLL